MSLRTLFGKPRMLASIEWDETSGVDHPANLEEGWAVIKAAAPNLSEGELSEIVEQEELLVKAQDALTRLIVASDDAGYFDSAPADVRKSLETLTSWLAKEGFGARGANDSASKPSARQRIVDSVRRLLGGHAAPADDSDEFTQFSDAVKACWPEFCEDILAVRDAAYLTPTAKTLAMKAMVVRLNNDVTSLVEDVQKVIRKEGEKWVLHSADGSKTLGTFDTREEAVKREQQIQWFKTHKALEDITVFKAKGDPSSLIDWFNSGADGQIDWGSEGDWQQCVDIAGNHMSEEQAAGFCALRHKEATDMTPAEHHAEMKS